jgi:hypothetical protein
MVWLSGSGETGKTHLHYQTASSIARPIRERRRAASPQGVPRSVWTPGAERRGKPLDLIVSSAFYFFMVQFR